MDGWMDGLMDGRARLRIAYSNKKTHASSMKKCTSLGLEVAKIASGLRTGPVFEQVWFFKRPNFKHPNTRLISR